MRLSAPSFIVFLISLVLALWATLPLLGVTVPASGLSAFWKLLIAYAILMLGVLFRKF